jgi:hypothetical protein
MFFSAEQHQVINIGMMCRARWKRRRQEQSQPIVERSKQMAELRTYETYDYFHNDGWLEIIGEQVNQRVEAGVRAAACDPGKCSATNAWAGRPKHHDAGYDD